MCGSVSENGQENDKNQFFCRRYKRVVHSSKPASASSDFARVSPKARSNHFGTEIDCQTLKLVN